MTDYAQLATAAQEVALLLRRGYFPSGLAKLQPFVDQWVEVANQELKTADGVGTLVTTKILMRDIGLAQKRGDNLRIADLVEYQILPWLESKLTKNQ